jgi:hypothetical protein
MINSSHQKLKEFVKEAELHSNKLSNWEIGFVSSMRGLVNRDGDFDDLSEKQQEAFKKIEEKLYSTD